jgi:hypothetical protein
LAVSRSTFLDLTDPTEWFANLSECRNIELADPDGKTHYVITSMGKYKDAGAPVRGII